MIIRPAFITPIFCFNIYDKKLNDSLREDAYLQEKNTNGRTISNFGGFQSNHVYDTPAVTSFIKKACECVYQVKNKLEFKRELSISGLWYNINKKGHLNKSHCHGGAVLAAVYYIDTPNNCGAINFENLDRHTIMLDNTRKYIHPYFNGFYTLTPKQGTLLIFYAWLNHSVDPNQSDQDRISLSFNVELK